MTSKADTVQGLVRSIQAIDIHTGLEQIVELANYYKGKYANWAEFALYHRMIGSTPRSTTPHEDFPDADSVITKLEEIRQRLSAIPGSANP